MHSFLAMDGGKVLSKLIMKLTTVTSLIFNNGWMTCRIGGIVPLRGKNQSFVNW